jgi:SH3 domain protein
MMPRISWAETVYVTDSFEVTFRSGPSSENKILSILRSGDSLEVLETGEIWTRVRLHKKNGVKVEGWVLNRYLITRQPWKKIAASLSQENAQLKQKLSELEVKWSKLAQDEKSIAKKFNESATTLNKLKKRYESLKEGSADYLNLKAEHEKTRSKLEVTEKKLDTLTIEANELRSSHGYKWFGMGALVLFSGLIIGLIFGRQQKRRKSSYY